MPTAPIHQDDHGQLHARLPAFVEDAGAHLRMDTHALRHHLDRMDAQAYGMLILSAMQMDIFDKIQVVNPEYSSLPNIQVQLEFEVNASVNEHIGRVLAESIEENLNSLQSDALSGFINRMKETGWMTRATCEDKIAEAYDWAFQHHHAASWKQARSAQQALDMQQSTPDITTQRPKTRL